MICRTIGLGLVVGVLCESALFASDVSPVSQEVTIKTSVGTIVVKLDSIAAPGACRAFLSYIRRNVYQGSAFYTVQDEVIQGGKSGPEAMGYSSSGNFVENPPPGEFSLKHVRGAVGLARTVGSCNPTKSSNSTQFYIVRKDFPKDDGEFSVFGHVVQGMDVVDRIAESLGAHKATPVQFDIVVQ